MLLGKAHHEEGHFESAVDQPHESQPMATVENTEGNVELNEADKKILLPMLAMKPLVVASGLLAGSMLPNKKRPTPRPGTPTENNVVVAIGNSDNVKKSED